MEAENTELETEAQPESEAVEATETNEAALEQEESPQASPAEDLARSHGWTDKQAWVDAGKNEEDWVNAKHFNRVGDLISEVRNNSRQHKGDIENLQNFQKLQLEGMKAKLEDERKEAVSLADEDAFASTDRQLNDVNKQLSDITAQQVQSDKALIDQENEWMSRNAWFNPQGNDEQSMTAKRIMAANPNLNGYAMTDLIDAEVSKPQSPQVNQNRERPSPTSKAKPTPQKAEAVTLDSMTPHERTMVSAVRNHNPKITDAAIIRMLKNSRG